MGALEVEAEEYWREGGARYDESEKALKSIIRDANYDRKSPRSKRRDTIAISVISLAV